MKNLWILSGFMLCLSSLQGQITLIPPVVSAYYVTPESIITAQVISTENPAMITLECSLKSNSGEPILFVRTGEISINQGSNLISRQTRLTEIQYFGELGTFVRTHQQLPTGNYELCIKLHGSILETQIQECQSFESEVDLLLSLVYPNDGDTIETTLPLLTWIHTGDFSLRSQDFRISLTEVFSSQQPAAAIRENPQQFTKSQLSTHTVPYPANAKSLEPGKHYAWQIELWQENRPVQFSEVWHFFIDEKKPEPVMKYVKLRKGMNAGLYRIVDERVYFSFDEAYLCAACLPQISITDMHGKVQNSEPAIDGKIALAIVNYNQFSLDTGPYNLSAGSYTMSILNSKNDKYELTIYVE